MPTPLLRTSLQTLFSGWKDDLTPQWRKFFADADVDPSQVTPALALASPHDVIFPGRKGAPPPGARTDAHVTRAFDGIPPADVRVVIIGQDPYLHVDQATGRSFEQADVGPTLAGVSPSLRRILQAVALVRTGDRKYAEGPAAWSRVLGDRTAGILELPPPLALWNHWQKAGVVFVNAAATFNRYQSAYQKAHLAFWAPVLRRLLQGLAERDGAGVVFVGWGHFARETLRRSGVEDAARSAGRWGRKVTIVDGPHPNAMGAGPPFLKHRSPFGEIDAALAQLGEAPIPW